jgi:hypothetical protein
VQLCGGGVAAAARRRYITSISALMPILLKMPFCPIFYNMLEIMDMNSNIHYDFP